MKCVCFDDMLTLKIYRFRGYTCPQLKRKYQDLGDCRASGSCRADCSDSVKIESGPGIEADHSRAAV